MSASSTGFANPPARVAPCIEADGSLTRHGGAEIRRASALDRGDQPFHSHNAAMVAQVTALRLRLFGDALRAGSQRSESVPPQSAAKPDPILKHAAVVAPRLASRATDVWTQTETNLTNANLLSLLSRQNLAPAEGVQDPMAHRNRAARSQLWGTEPR